MRDDAEENAHCYLYYSFARGEEIEPKKGRPIAGTPFGWVDIWSYGISATVAPGCEALVPT